MSAEEGVTDAMRAAAAQLDGCGVGRIARALLQSDSTGNPHPPSILVLLVMLESRLIKGCDGRSRSLVVVLGAVAHNRKVLVLLCSSSAGRVHRRLAGRARRLPASPSSLVCSLPPAGDPGGAV